MIFVHGFKGHPLKSWQHFPFLVDHASYKPEDFQDTDLYFFDYDAAGNHIPASVQDLARFIAGLYPVPPVSLFRYSTGDLDWRDRELLEIESAEIRSGPYAYDKIVLVGHSMGAVVIRHLVQSNRRDWETKRLVQADAPPPPLLSAQIYLFAPAHLGVVASGLPSVGIGLLERFELGFVLSRYRAYIHLTAKSDSIRELRESTEEGAVKYPMLTAFGAEVLFGRKEWLVFPGAYRCDRERPYVDGKGHLDICKPDVNFETPLDFLRESAVQCQRA